MATVTAISEAEQAAHNAAWAIPALLSDRDLVEAWEAHWRAYEAYGNPYVWFDRFRELLAEAKYRQLALSYLRK